MVYIWIPLKDLYPVFRGRILDIPNFDSQRIVELGFLIGNKKPEKFEKPGKPEKPEKTGKFEKPEKLE